VEVRVTCSGVRRQHAAKFGIREIKSELDRRQEAPVSTSTARRSSSAARLVLGHAAALRPRAVEDELRYVQDMGLNTVRLEGKLEPEHFFDVSRLAGACW
jgi:hypothetical protein